MFQIILGESNRLHKKRIISQKLITPEKDYKLYSKKKRRRKANNAPTAICPMRANCVGAGRSLSPRKKEKRFHKKRLLAENPIQDQLDTTKKRREKKRKKQNQ